MTPEQIAQSIVTEFSRRHEAANDVTERAMSMAWLSKAISAAIRALDPETDE